MRAPDGQKIVENQLTGPQRPSQKSHDGSVGGRFVAYGTRPATFQPVPAPLPTSQPPARAVKPFSYVPTPSEERTTRQAKESQEPPVLSIDDALPVIRKLSERQKEAFSQICVGDDSCLNPETAKALARRGLIQYGAVDLPGDRFGIRIWRAEVASIAVHIAWCQWCAETVPDETT